MVSRHSKMTAPILTTLDSLETRAVELGAADIASIVVEPILTRIGWKTDDPSQVRRPRFGGFSLRRDGIEVLDISCLSLRSPLPEAMPDGSNAPAPEWQIVTNGRDWHLFHREMTHRPFRTFTLRDEETAEDAGHVLDLVAPANFALDSLRRAISAETLDAEVLQALARHLDGSDALIDAIAPMIGDRHNASRSEIAGALARIPVRLPHASDIATPPSVDSSPPAVPTAARKPAKPRAPRKRSTLSSLARVPILPADVEKKPDPATLTWPEGTTHAMRRKHTYAFIRFRTRDEATTLLPGSVLTANLGTTLTKEQVASRKDAERLGNLAPVDGMLVVMAPLTFPNPRQAATFAAGTLVKDMAAWKSRSGKTLKDQMVESSEETAPDDDTSTSDHSDTPASDENATDKGPKAVPA